MTQNTGPAAQNFGAVCGTKCQVRKLSAALEQIAAGIRDAQAACGALQSDTQQVEGVHENVPQISDWLSVPQGSMRFYQDLLRSMTAQMCGEHYATALAAQDERAREHVAATPAAE